MAVLKHIAIKNADYSAAVCYLKYQHDERHLKPLLDENGSMMLRSEFHMNGVNCNPDTFDLECEMLNDQYRKNYRYDEVKSHHYIISFDPRDKDEHHLTGEKAQTLGLEFVKNHLPGHQALVCTHTDKTFEGQLKPSKPFNYRRFSWLTLCGCQVRNKNFCKKISLSEPKPIRFQTQKDFSCYFLI